MGNNRNICRSTHKSEVELGSTTAIEAEEPVNEFPAVEEEAPKTEPMEPGPEVKPVGPVKAIQ